MSQAITITVRPAAKAVTIVVRGQGSGVPGGPGLTPIAENHYGTHPAINTMDELAAWLLENAYTR